MTQRSYPQEQDSGDAVATPVLGYVSPISQSELKANPNAGLHPGQPVRPVGPGERVREVPAGYRRSAVALRRRAGAGGRCPPRDRPRPGRHRGDQHRPGPPGVRAGRAAEHHQRRQAHGGHHDRQVPDRQRRGRRRARRPDRGGAGHGLVAHLQPERVGGWDLRGQLPVALGQLRQPGLGHHRVPALQLRHRRRVHPRLDLQAQHGHGGIGRRHHQRRHLRQRHRRLPRSPEVHLGLHLQPTTRRRTPARSTCRRPSPGRTTTTSTTWATCSTTRRPADGIQQMAADYGLGEPTGIDLPGGYDGQVDSATLRATQHRENPTAFPYPSYYVGDNIETAFGQGETLVTPIQQAVAYATFANGGTRYQPEVAAAVVSPSGKVVTQFAPKVTGHVPLPASTYGPMLAGFEGVVANPAGTAYGSFQQYAKFPMSSYPIAGKTGTADVGPNKEPNSWFVGFGPTNHAADQPEYVVVVVIDHGGYGAQAAAPAVAQIYNYLYTNPLQPVQLPTADHLAGRHATRRPIPPPGRPRRPPRPPRPPRSRAGSRPVGLVVDGVPLATDRTTAPRRGQAGALHRGRAGGTVPRAPSGRGGLDAPVPRHLRDRPAQPGVADPLRDPQRAAGRPGRTGLCALGRHGGGDAVGRRAALQRGAARRRPALRRDGLQPLRRAGLHQRPQPPRPGRGAAARRRTGSGGPVGRRRGALRLQPRTVGRLRRRLRPGRRRRGRGGDQRGPGRRGWPGAEPRPGDRERAPTRPGAGRRGVRPGALPFDLPRRPTRLHRAHPAGRARRGGQADGGRPGRVALSGPPLGAPDRGRARPAERRGLPGLHPRLPVLPGRHDHPPGPRAAGRSRSPTWCARDWPGAATTR